MREANPNTRTIFLMLALIAAVEIFGRAPVCSMVGTPVGC